MKWRSKFFLVLALLLAVGAPSMAQDEGIEEDDYDDGVVTDEEEDAPSEPESSFVDDETYVSPYPEGPHYFSDNFDDVNEFNKKWVRSEAKKDDADDLIAKYDGLWMLESPLRDAQKGDLGLVLKSKAKHAAISALLDKPFFFKDRPLVVQYEVNFQNGQECGGAYIKLISHDASKKQKQDLKKFHDKTPYTIMFGPDKCGNDHKLHFIFRHKNPLNGTIEEKHAKKPKDRLEETFKDKRPHLYTLVVNPDNSYQISVDHKVVNIGNLLEDFSPPVNPPAEIDDPEDFKPTDWDEREKIPDPEARKPEDWDEDAPAQIPDVQATKPTGWLDDEPDHIPDPNAEKPGDWDEEMDGEWEAPLVPNPLCEGAPGCGEWKPPNIDNPAYRGKWRPSLIDNPNYKGKWRPRRIPNPDFFEDLEPFRMTPIDTVGFELWSMSDDILFDNLLLTDNLLQAEKFAADSFDIKRIKLDKQASSLWGRMLKQMNYKPGYWAIYGIYCCIPIICYVYYLYTRVREDSLFTRLMAYTTEHPWLWAVYVMIVGLPIVAFFVFCCGGPTRRPDDIGERKKTDAPSPDDPGFEGEAEVQARVATSSKGDLDAPQDEEEEEEEGEGEGEESGEEEEGEEEKDKEEEEEVVKEKTSKGSPRRRKPRKE